ncbi:type III-A CRISPR-associated protein Csm2 [Desulfothermus naphthae]
MTMDLKLKTKDGCLNPEAFSVHAEKLAGDIFSEGGRSKNKSSQLRRFYDEFFKLNQRSASYNDKEWEKVILPQLHMLVPKVVYAQGRKLVTDKFVDFIKSLVFSVKTKQDFKIATDFFEAFIGFYRKYSDK